MSIATTRSVEETGPPLLAVRDLRIHFDTEEGVVKAVDGVGFEIRRGRVLGLVGESGSGKSLTALAALRILPPRARLVSGKILLAVDHGDGPPEPVDLARLDPKGRRIRAIRGRDIGVIFQEPMTSFASLYTIGNQIAEMLLLHRAASRAEARELAIGLLARVGIPEPAQRFDEYPHTLSGGMRQRAMIAMALACRPALLVADEPTTALDVTIQAQVLELELLAELRAELKMAILFITHNLGVIADMADEVAVMYLGEIVEAGSVERVFTEPRHPYTRALLAAVPRIERPARSRLAAIEGSVPMAIGMTDACRFMSRCPMALPGTCDVAHPTLEEILPGHRVRCWRCSPEGVATAGAAPAGELAHA